jgi:NAD(P)H-hydrate epimerase
MNPRDLTHGFRAACVGAYLHGLAGDIAVKKFPTGSLLASDLAGVLPAALKRIKTSS